MAGKDYRDADLRNVDLRDKVLFRTDLRGAQLYNVGISVSCDTFHGVAIDDEAVALLLLLIAMAHIDGRWIAGLYQLVESTLGRDKTAALSRYLQLHLK